VDRTLLYDGDCGFCTTTAAWVSQRWPKHDAPRAVPWQLLSAQEVLASALSSDDLASAAWWLDGHRRDRGARAVARALIATESSWSVVGRILLVPPVSWVAPWGYRLIARFRYRLPGGTPACKL